MRQDARFPFRSEQYQNALESVLGEVAAKAPLTLLSGETGVGKTLLIEELLLRINKDKTCDPRLIMDPRGDAGFILNALIAAFPSSDATDDPWRAFWAGIEDTRIKGQSPMVIIDDAHALSNEGAIALGKLVTGDRGKAAPVPVLLVGQPQLTRKVNLPALRLMKAVLGKSVILQALAEDEIGPYIDARLQRAGAAADNNIFESGTWPMIYEATGGVPHKVNKLSEICLFLAGESGAKSVTENALQALLTTYDDTNDVIVEEEPDTLPEPIVLPEPKFRADPQPKPMPTKVEPVPPPPQAQIRSVLPPPELPKKSKRTAPRWIAAALAAAAAYALSPYSPLPKDNPVMTAIYGQPEAINLDNNAATFVSETSVIDETPTIAPTPQEVAAEELTPVTLTTLTRTYDPKTDPADGYFEKALAETDPQQTAITYARAAVRGHARSALYLGQLFETGAGTTFAPEVGAHWYNVAGDTTLLDQPGTTKDLTSGGIAEPLFSAAQGQQAEFVWQGKADMFRLELGDANGDAIAQFTTPLTAALVDLPANAVSWRVSTDPTQTTNWSDIGEKGVD